MLLAWGKMDKVNNMNEFLTNLDTLIFSSFIYLNKPNPFDVANIDSTVQPSTLPILPPAYQFYPCRPNLLEKYT